MRNYYKCMAYAYPNLTHESNKPIYIYLHNEITVPEEIIDFNPVPKQPEPVIELAQPITLRRLIPSQTSQDAPERTQDATEVGTVVKRITLTGGGGTLTTYGAEEVNNG